MKLTTDQQPVWAKKQPDSYVLGTFEHDGKSLNEILQQIETIQGVTKIIFNNPNDITIETIPSIQVLDITLDTETNSYQIIAVKNKN